MSEPKTPTEGLMEIDGSGYYAVPDVDRMAPFLMSIVSDGDRWMFISSTGALTAGRGDAAGAVFPYATDDLIHASAGHVGPVTSIRVGEATWLPFAPTAQPGVRRSLYKSVVGESIIFEESNGELGLTFRYSWESCDRFGFVRTATLVNETTDSISVQVIDGLVNILPHGLSPFVYQRVSNLTNAYKRSELVGKDSRLGVFSLESGVVDRPEPAEVLRATAVWSTGLANASVTLSPDVLSGALDDVSLVTGTPGAYLLKGGAMLEAGGAATWRIVIDAGLDQAAVTGLRDMLESDDHVDAAITRSLDEASDALVAIMARADAMQRTGDRVATAHHFSNVTYNTMRGGVPLDGYVANKTAFSDFVRNRNQATADLHETLLASLPETIGRADLLDLVEDAGDVDLIRLTLEYLPFSFSRRHGDPSRPWNMFSIRVRDDEGEPIIYYEGNWRDIFQNWEALALSFPEYLPGMISAFVNASTTDGFNPYRITSDGIDWEVPDPLDPWSNIGYWGDHQVVYLLRLLEATDRFSPGAIHRLLGKRWFTYADVPYRLAAYDELVRDPKATIDFVEAAHDATTLRVEEVGADGKLLWTDSGKLYRVTLVEKLLVPALSKLSNFVPGGGIWMNTQRPEWNDANNALVGHGLSMVTLYHLRRYLDYLRSLLRTADVGDVKISSEVAGWMAALASTFTRMKPNAADMTDEARKDLLDTVGRAFSEYRARVYAFGFSGRTKVAPEAIAELCDAAIEHLDDTIRTGRRSDGLYHSYNLIHFNDATTEASVEHLYEMLEGQVAVIGSGVLSPEERADIVDALFDSSMYRADQDSFMLYPARQLPSFLEKNVVPEEAVEANPLLRALLESGDQTVVTAGPDGSVRFDADFAKQDDLEIALDRLAGVEEWSDLVATHRDQTLDAYEHVFNHHAYTGRSGSMYGYEGIGSIYWHMVAKLAVAVQEAAFEAVAAGAAPETIERLVGAFWRVRAGLGFNKTATEFGAIPIDPYSHTPGHAGAQQPGMTGLVKEELLTRPAEVGVRVDGGEIHFDQLFLRGLELVTEAETWQLLDTTLGGVIIELVPGSLGTTLCQVPIVVARADGDAQIEVELADGTTRVQPGSSLDAETSSEVFGRTGSVAKITARVPSGPND